MIKIILGFLVLILTLGAFVFLNPPQSNLQEKLEQASSSAALASAVTVFSQNLRVPWALDFLPASPAGESDQRMLLTERSGEIKIIDSQGKSKTIATIPVYSQSESGLHGIAIDPDFETTKNVYLYYTYQSSGNNTLNRVVRYTFENNKLTEDKSSTKLVLDKIIVDQIPGAPNHDGGRIKFGPDKFLYITTGDAQDPSRAQDRNSLGGKILKVDRNGQPAPGNPFGTRIFSYGHRNPQGIAFENQNLWATEHGRSPGGLDELNLIEKGKNYGWPAIQGKEMRTEMETPIINSGRDTWAPSGAAFLNGSIFFAGLRGEALYEYKISEQKLIGHFKNQYGRLREVVVGPDNMLYVTTSNFDGRGNPRRNDDKILKIDPQKL